MTLPLLLGILIGANSILLLALLIYDHHKFTSYKTAVEAFLPRNEIIKYKPDIKFIRCMFNQETAPEDCANLLVRRMRK